MCAQDLPMANEVILLHYRCCICSVEHEQSDLERPQGFQAVGQTSSVSDRSSTQSDEANGHSQSWQQEHLSPAIRSVARALLSVGVQPTPSTLLDQAAKKRGRCQPCSRKQHQKVEHRCTKCNQFVCGKHGRKELMYTCLKCPLACDAEENDWRFDWTGFCFSWRQLRLLFAFYNADYVAVFCKLKTEHKCYTPYSPFFLVYFTSNTIPILFDLQMTTTSTITRFLHSF